MSVQVENLEKNMAKLTIEVAAEHCRTTACRGNPRYHRKFTGRIFCAHLIHE